MKKIFLNVSLALMALLTPLALSTIPVAAACPGVGSSQGQILEGVGQTGSDCSDKGVTDTVKVVVTVISFIAGIAAIIMVLVSGFKYITSSGDAGKVGSAKNTLIYALVGIAIAAVAQVFVHFAINTASKTANACADGIAGHSSLSASDPKCK